MKSNPIKAVIFNYLMPFVVIVATLQVLLVAAFTPAMAQPALLTAEGASIVESQGISDPHITATVGDVMMGYQEVDEVALNDVFNTPVGDDLSYSVSGHNPSIVSVSASDDLTLAETDLAARLASISGSPTDTRGRNAGVEDAFTVARNDPPTVTKPIPNQSVGPRGKVSLYLPTFFSDPDGDALRFRVWYDETDLIFASLFDNRLTITGVMPGLANLRVTATDEQGSNSTVEVTFSVTVTNNNVPMVKAPIDDQTIGTGGIFSVDLATVFTDIDDDDLTFEANSNATDKATVSIANNTLTVTGVTAGSASITVSATDKEGSNTKVEDNFTVTVTSNNVPRVIRQIPDQSVGPRGKVSIDLPTFFTDPDGDALRFRIWYDDTDLISTSLFDNRLTITGVTPGLINLRVTATDEQGSNHTVEVTFTVTVTTNNVPMVKKSIGDQTIGTGGTFIVDLTTVFTDTDKDDLTFEANSDATDRATVSIANNTLTVTGVTAGSASITVSATDKGGSNTKVEDNFTVTVTSNNAPRVVRQIPDQSVGPRGKVTLYLPTFFSDPDGDALRFRGWSDESDLISTLLFDNRLTITGVTPGLVNIRVTATDEQGSNHTVELTFTVTVTDNNVPMVENSIRDQTIGTGGTFIVDLTTVFTDIDKDDLTFAADSDATDRATVSIANNTLTVTGVTAGSASIRVTATDEQGSKETAEDNFTVTVTSNKIPTIIGQIPDQTIGRSGKFSIDLTTIFSDPDGDALRHRFGGTPSDIVSGLIYDNTLIVTGDKAGTASFVVRATDEQGSNHTVETTFTITVLSNYAPRVKKLLWNKRMDITNTYTEDLTTVFTDRDGDALTYSAESGDDQVATVVMSNNTVTVTAVGQGRTKIIVSATDEGGSNTKTDESFYVTVSSNHDPTVTNPIEDQTLGIGGTYIIDLNTVFSDADGDQVYFSTYASSLYITNLTLPRGTSVLTVTARNAGTSTVYVTGGDGVGQTTNWVTHSFEVTVLDNRIPTVANQIADQTISIGGTYSVDLTTVFSDADDDNLKFTASSDDINKATVEISNNTLTVTGVAAGAAGIKVTATDEQGSNHTVEDDFTVTVERGPQR